MITGLLNHQQYQCISMLVLMVQKCKNQLRLAVYPIKFTMVFFKPIQTVVGNLGFLNHQQCYLFCFLQKCGKIPIRNGQDLPPSIIRTRSWGISEDGQGNKKFKLIEYMLLTSHLEVSYIHVYREMIWKKAWIIISTPFGTPMELIEGFVCCVNIHVLQDPQAGLPIQATRPVSFLLCLQSIA